MTCHDVLDAQYLYDTTKDGEHSFIRASEYITTN